MFISRALVLAPFHPPALERLKERVDVTYESWMDTRKLREEMGFNFSYSSADAVATFISCRKQPAVR